MSTSEDPQQHTFKKSFFSSVKYSFWYQFAFFLYEKKIARCIEAKQTIPPALEHSFLSACEHFFAHSTRQGLHLINLNLLITLQNTLKHPTPDFYANFTQKILQLFPSKTDLQKALDLLPSTPIPYSTYHTNPSQYSNHTAFGQYTKKFKTPTPKNTAAHTNTPIAPYNEPLFGQALCAGHVKTAFLFLEHGLQWSYKIKSNNQYFLPLSFFKLFKPVTPSRAPTEEQKRLQHLYLEQIFPLMNQPFFDAMEQKRRAAEKPHALPIEQFHDLEHVSKQSLQKGIFDAARKEASARSPKTLALASSQPLLPNSAPLPLLPEQIDHVIFECPAFFGLWQPAGHGVSLHTAHHLPLSEILSTLGFDDLWKHFRLEHQSAYEKALLQNATLSPSFIQKHAKKKSTPIHKTPPNTLSVNATEEPSSSPVNAPPYDVQTVSQQQIPSPPRAPRRL